MSRQVPTPAVVPPASAGDEQLPMGGEVASTVGRNESKGTLGCHSDCAAAPTSTKDCADDGLNPSKDAPFVGAAPLAHPTDADMLGDAGPSKADSRQMTSKAVGGKTQLQGFRRMGWNATSRPASWSPGGAVPQTLQPTPGASGPWDWPALADPSHDCAAMREATVRRLEGVEEGGHYCAAGESTPCGKSPKHQDYLEESGCFGPSEEGTSVGDLREATSRTSLGADCMLASRRPQPGEQRARAATAAWNVLRTTADVAAEQWRKHDEMVGMLDELDFMAEDAGRSARNSGSSGTSGEGMPATVQDSKQGQAVAIGSQAQRGGEGRAGEEKGAGAEQES
eukprot:TRINITY_DN19894_c0_g1_i3.p1 TRINITY_DN19894_c0_g1~~TRINITY_DN19894_c0_g1_i3.p1  ORF type:complete len:339 (+),score=76.11 TRINITY_DN19894_c0_g1_i3:76-1092(+)